MPSRLLPGEKIRSPAIPLLRVSIIWQMLNQYVPGGIVAMQMQESGLKPAALTCMLILWSKVKAQEGTTVVAARVTLQWLCSSCLQLPQLRVDLRSFVGMQAAALFYFMFAEAPNLPLQPPLILSPQDVYRLQKYTASIAFRYQTAASGAAASAASNGSGIAQLPVTSPAAASTTRDAAAGPAPAAAAIATQ